MRKRKDPNVLELINEFDPTVRIEMKEFLEQKALEGWKLTDVYSNRFIFERTEPQPLVYLIEYFKETGDDELIEKYKASCAQNGWKAVNSEFEYIINVGTKELSEPIDIGDKVRLKHMKTAWINWRNLSAAFNIILILMLAVIRFPSSMAAYYLSLFLIGICILTSLFSALYKLPWYTKNVINVKKGIKLSYIDDKHKKPGTLRAVLLSLAVLFVSLLPAYLYMYNLENTVWVFFAILFIGLLFIIIELVERHKKTESFQKSFNKIMMSLTMVFLAIMCVTYGYVSLKDVKFTGISPKLTMSDFGIDSPAVSEYGTDYSSFLVKTDLKRISYGTGFVNYTVMKSDVSWIVKGLSQKYCKKYDLYPQKTENQYGAAEIYTEDNADTDEYFLVFENGFIECIVSDGLTDEQLSAIVQKLDLK